MSKCINGHEVADNLKFCPTCGVEIKENSIKFCPNCGNERKASEKFCTKCGTPYGQSLAGPDTEPPVVVTEVESHQDDSYKKGIIIAGIIALILLLGGVTGYLAWRHFSSSEGNDEEELTKVLENGFFNSSGQLPTNDYKYLSADFRAMIERCNEGQGHEPWDIMWNTGSDVGVEDFHVTDITSKNDSIIRVACDFTISGADDDYFVETFYFDMIEENGKWLIYDIEHNGSSARSDLAKGISVVTGQEEVFTVVYAISDDGFLNVRAQPSNNGAILTKLYEPFHGLGNGVLLERGDKWSKVYVNGHTGWVYSPLMGDQTWYDGTGATMLVASRDNTPIYSETQADDVVELPLFTTVKKGTIIADRFSEADEYYSLITAHDYLFVKKRDVEVVRRR